ncbi:uncharacterized protein [Antennarius striatus]|uniref:uncharacterized protein n=1 Tax=Antennarius striatus TaxID=241820 RepID=UPI0035B35BF1
MAISQRAMQHPPVSFRLSVLLLLSCSSALRDGRQEERVKSHILNSTEIPAEHIDPAAIDLTPLVNTLINSSQSGSRQLFSLLSVTSYSSLALHKLTLLVYNISTIRNIESNTFQRRFCYCVTNETNDLTGGSSTWSGFLGGGSVPGLGSVLFQVWVLFFLHHPLVSCRLHGHPSGRDRELNQLPPGALQIRLHPVSEPEERLRLHLHLCDGGADGDVSRLWDVDSVTPLFNRTIVEGPHRGNISSIRFPVEWQHPLVNLSHISPSGISSMLTSRVHSTAHGE